MPGKIRKQRTRTSIKTSPSKKGEIMSPRPCLTLVVQNTQIAEIWVNGRAPIITIHDYDWGETDPFAVRDDEGFPFSPINWNRPAWMLGLSLYPPEFEHASAILDQKIGTPYAQIDAIYSHLLSG